MKRALAVIVAVLVSIVWLSPPLAIGAAALNLWDPMAYIPPEVTLLMEQYNIDVSQLPGIADLLPVPTEEVAGEPEVVAMDTATPEPPTETPSPEPPTETPTPDLPTETPTPTATLDARASILATIQAANALTNTTGITETVAPADGAPVQVRLANDANVRSGPGTEFDTVGQVAADATVTVVGRDSSGEWFLLDDGTWVFAGVLVEEPNVPVIVPTPAVADTSGTPGATTPITNTPGLANTERLTRTITSDSNLRAGPGITFDNVGGVTANSEVVIVGRFATDNWYLIADGTWVFGALLNEAATTVPAVNAQGIITEGSNAGQSVLSPSAAVPEVATPDAATPTPASAARVQTTTNIAANLRSGPGTTFNVTGSIASGATVTITGRNAAGDWFQLEDGSWIFGQLLTTPPATVPVIP